MKVVQHHSYLRSLVIDVMAGRVFPAAFQRSYAWSKADVLALVNSVIKGYPLGSVMLWRPSQDTVLATALRGRLGPIVASEKQAHATMLLDGQNRLASMAWLAYDFDTPAPDGVGPMERITWMSGEVLVFDLLKKEAVFVPIADAHTGFLVPGYAVLDPKRGNQITRERWDKAWSVFSEAEKESGVTWLDLLQSKFREAPIVVTILENATVAEAKDAFLHICRAGVAMSTKEFDAALAFHVEEVPVQPESTAPQLVTRESLIASGFAPCFYPGDAGEYLKKVLNVSDMPYMSEKVATRDGMGELDWDDQMTVEVTPDWKVQMAAVQGDYMEEPVDVNTPDGMGVLVDAGFSHIK